MSTPFPRSTRALRADGFRYAIGAIAIAAVLMILWLIWFFSAEIKSWESSSSAKLVAGRTIMAQFPKAKLRHILRGQPANFFPDQDELDNELVVVAGKKPENLAAGIAARVRYIVPADQENPGTVELVLVPAQRRLPLMTGNLSGRVEIEVATQTPAELINHSGGAGLEQQNASQ